MTTEGVLSPRERERACPENIYQQRARPHKTAILTVADMNALPHLHHVSKNHLRLTSPHNSLVIQHSAHAVMNVTLHRSASAKIFIDGLQQGAGDK